MQRAQIQFGFLLSHLNQMFGGYAANDATELEFVELGARTAFSALGIHGPIQGETYADLALGWPGSGTPEAVVNRVAAFEGRTVGITDLGTVAGLVRAFRQGQSKNVRLVVGCEVPFAQGSLWVHVANPTGYANLCAFLTQSRAGLEKDETNFQLANLCSLSSGLWVTVLPGFAADEIPSLQAHFADRISAALYAHDLPEDRAVLFWAKWMHERFGIPPLATARPFLVDNDELEIHHLLTCIRQQRMLNEAARSLLPNGEARLRATFEMTENVTRWRREWAEMPCPILRSTAVARNCRFEFSHLKWEFPADVPVGVSPEQELKNRVLRGACERYRVADDIDVPVEVREQIQHELNLVSELGVANYFLTVHDVVRIARQRDILCQGRGSAANSVVCFCLGITSIDPVRMDLLFERFISKERGEPPDIDVDFEHERREEVIQAIYEKWGRSHAVMVSEVISYRGRSAIRAVGKALGFAPEAVSQVAELMLRTSLEELTSARLSDAQIEESQERIEQLVHLARRLQKYPQHLGVHVGGFILTKAPITTVTPVEPARMPDRTVMPFDKDDVETLGLFKIDVLGLGMLTCIRKALSLVAKHESRVLDLAGIPPEDPQVYDALCRADTIGVFQVESRAQMAMLPRMKPRTFYDLVVEVSIVRPGPIQGGMVHPYLRRRSGEEPVKYPHPSLAPILKRTLGVPIFQEQVMKLAITGAGYTPGEADQLRRDMAAWKKKGGLHHHRARLLAGFRERGISDEFSKKLFLQVVGFGEYGFPESHAASFAILVYASAWLKVHYPAHFAAALLNSQPMGFYSPSQIVADLQRHGVTVHPVSVQHSFWDSTLEPHSGKGGWALRLGLRSIRNLSSRLGEALVMHRQADGPFLHRGDFERRVRPDRRALSVLSMSGALDCFHVHRRESIYESQHETLPLWGHAKAHREDPPLSAPRDRDILRWDLAATRLSLDDHPVNHLRQSLMKHRSSPLPPPLSDVLAQQPSGRTVDVLGLVIGRQRPGTASGTCFVTLEDESGVANVIVWNSNFEKWRSLLKSSPFLWVRGKLEKKNEAAHVIAAELRGFTGAEEMVHEAQGRFFR